MEILRQEFELNGNKLLIHLPENYSHKKVEIVINPISNVNKNNENYNNSDLKTLLLNGPVLNEEEKKRFNNINKEFEKWEKSLFA